jgi:hypothetical protein
MKGGEKYMNKIIAISGILVIAGVLYFSLNKQTAYAATTQRGNGQGIGRQQMLTEKAKIFNMSETNLQNELNKGKTFNQIATEKGIDLNTMHERMEAFQKTRLQALVNQGTITKEQMQERLDFMEGRQENCGNNVPMSGQGGRGMGMHR